MRGRILKSAIKRSIAVMLAASMVMAAGCSGTVPPDNQGNVQGQQDNADSGNTDNGGVNNDTDNGSEGNNGSGNGSIDNSGSGTGGSGNGSGTGVPSGGQGSVMPAAVKDLMENYMIGFPDLALETETKLRCENAITEFGLKFFREAAKETDENIMVSPMSLLYAMALAANGANGDTLKEAEAVFGEDMWTLNLYLGQYMQRINGLASDNLKINIADSIWFRDDLPVKESFLEKNGTTLGAQLYQTTFDNQAVEAINGWVNSNTFGMIPKLIDEIKSEDMMYLINAAAVKAKWKDQFGEEITTKEDFYVADGKPVKVDMMYSGEERQYIEDAHATGFIKPYSEGLSFAALLPEEGMSASQYVETLTGEHLLNMLRNPSPFDVSIKLPRFTGTCDIELDSILKKLGFDKLTDPMEADLSGISDEELYVSGGIQKTFIKVNEEGTEAAAVTGVTVAAASYTERQVKEVYLDRPFVYVIMDNESRLPLFIGIYQQPET